MRGNNESEENKTGKYICINCSTVFTNPKHVTEQYGEVMDVCPECNGEYVLAFKCDICQEYITDNFIKTKDGQLICEECFFTYNINDDNLEGII